MFDKYWKIFRQHREAILYLFFGGLTFVVNYVIYFACSRLLPVKTTLLPTIIAWVVAVLFAYLTNRKWVFESKATTSQEIGREVASFTGARVFTGLLEVAIMWLAVDVFDYNDIIFKLLSSALVILLNYVFSKLWVFRKK